MRSACVAVAVLAAVGFSRGLIWDSSPTYDEPVHLAAGYAALAEGDYRLNAMDHPPLGEMWAAAPLLFLHPDRFASDESWREGRAYHFGDLFLYRNRAPAARLLGAARLWNAATLTALVAAALAAWAWRLGGAPAAWGAAGALALCVPWFSNAALVTTDAPSAALFFVACAILAGSGRSRRRWLAAGAVAGGALAAKFNMILLPPLAALALASERGDDRVRPADAAWSAAMAAAILAAAYRGRVGLYFDGLTATLSRLAEGRGSYLLGAHSTSGWWWYFPAAMLVKTPLALLLVGGFGACLARIRPRRESAWLLIPPLGYLAAAMASKTQIGIRHLLPVYPFLCLWAGLGASALWRRGKGGQGALAAVAAWLCVSAAAASPHPLSYFNEIARGRGERWLSDSNLDWGQDLPALARELAARGNPPIVLSYFGSGDPRAYGIRYVPLAMATPVPREGNAALVPGGPVLVAVSETNLVGTYYRNPALFDWLRSRRPAAVPGGSIFLYDLTADADGRARLAAMLKALGRPHDARALGFRPSDLGMSRPEPSPAPSHFRG